MTRSFRRSALATLLVAGVFVESLGAQQPGAVPVGRSVIPTVQLPVPQQRPIQRAALAEFRAKTGADAGFKLVLDPMVHSAFYSPSFEALERRPEAFLPSPDVDSLAAALGGTVATDGQMGGCRGTPRRCGRLTTQGLMIIRVGEPAVRGDTAVVGVIGIHLKGSGRTANIQFSDSWLIRLVRTGSTWKSESVNALCAVTKCTGAGM